MRTLYQRFHQPALYFALFWRGCPVTSFWDFWLRFYKNQTEERALSWDDGTLYFRGKKCPHTHSTITQVWSPFAVVVVLVLPWQKSKPSVCWQWCVRQKVMGCVRYGGEKPGRKTRRKQKNDLTLYRKSFIVVTIA